MGFARAPRASKRWHAEGLADLLRAAGAPPTVTRPCYAGQDLLLVCEKEVDGAHARRLPVLAEHL